MNEEINCKDCIHLKSKWYQGFFERGMRPYCEAKNIFIRSGYWLCSYFDKRI